MQNATPTSSATAHTPTTAGSRWESEKAAVAEPPPLQSPDVSVTSTPLFDGGDGGVPAMFGGTYNA